MAKHALVLFTKAPAPGHTKTRLTKAHGGVLSPQDAANLYRSTLMDVSRAATRALQVLAAEPINGEDQALSAYDFYVSCPSESDQERLKEIFEETSPWPLAIHYITDRGVNFDEHFNDAFRQLFALGYGSVVTIGGDIPSVRVDHLQAAFQWLAYLGHGSEHGALVLAPCQDCGVSLVGITANAPIDFVGVFYNLQGVSALEKIVALASAQSIPLAVLDTIADIDNVGDLAHAITLMRAMAYASHVQPGVLAPENTLRWVRQNRIIVTTPPNQNHDPRESLDAVH